MQSRSKDQCLPLIYTHTHTHTRTYTIGERQRASFPQTLCATTLRTCFTGITVAQQTVPPPHTHFTHTRALSPSDSTLISKRTSEQQDRMPKSADQRGGFTRWSGFFEKKAGGRRCSKWRRRKKDALFLPLQLALSARVFSGSIVPTSLQRGHSEERGRTQKGGIGKGT